MIKKLLLFSSLFCMLSFGCKTYEMDELPSKQLRFGNGGGYAGMQTEYTLLENGQVFVRTGRAGAGELQKLGSIKPARAKAMYKSWESNDSMKENIRQPGNRYYFICMKKDSVEYRQSWGAGQFEPDTSIIAFFDEAMSLMKTIIPEEEKQ